jgi:polyhydroxybutyrate depolymerase
MINGTSDPVVPYKGGTGKTTSYTTLSVEESAKTWAKFNNCDANKPKRTDLPPQEKGGEKVQVDKFDCKADAEVLLYSVKGAGNTWPGGAQFLPEKEVGKTSRDLDANEVIWKFFEAHKLPADTVPKS